MVLGEDAGECGAGFFTAVLVIAGEEDDVGALANSFGTFVDKRFRMQRES